MWACAHFAFEDSYDFTRTPTHPTHQSLVSSPLPSEILRYTPPSDAKLFRLTSDRQVG